MFLWWHNFRFKRRWQRVYRNAVPLPGLSLLHFSLSDPSAHQNVIESTTRVWAQIDAEDRRKLQLHWESLQKRWNSRETGLSLHIPLFGVYCDFSTAISLYVDLTDLVDRARAWNGYRESPADVYQSFAGLLLGVYADMTKFDANDLDLVMARRFASYLHCANNRREVTEYLVFHGEAEKLVEKWKFDTKRSYDYSKITRQ